MQFSEQQTNFLNFEGHALVQGGPGSGKTTVAIQKASKLTEALKYEDQRVLFLSFARPTVARVIEALNKNDLIPKSQKKKIEIETYHSFFWKIIKTHGYLVGLPRNTELLIGGREAEELVKLRQDFKGHPRESEGEEVKEKYKISKQKLHEKLAYKKGLIAFDQFAPLVSKLLENSSKIRNLVALKYPIIFLDEFQDTDEEQWKIVKLLQENTQVIALADPEQRIYGWKGASPERINQFKAQFNPTEFDFQKQNYRSNGTDIALFGDEVLTGNFTKDISDYSGIVVLPKYGGVKYADENMAMSTLLPEIYRSRKRLTDLNVQNWSLAILTGSKETTKRISQYLSFPTTIPKNTRKWASVEHRPVFDLEAAILGAEVLAVCLEKDDLETGQDRFVEAVCRYLLGKNGSDRAPSSSNISEANTLREQYQKLRVVKKLSKNSKLAKVLEAYSIILRVELEGNPFSDWAKMRNKIEGFESGILTKKHPLCEAASATRFLRMLSRSEDLRQMLATDWQENGKYENAKRIVQSAFQREHFSMGNKPEQGIVVMNVHKAKGKEFDEVIIFDGFDFRDKRTGNISGSKMARIAYGNKCTSDTRQNLRVGITRARLRTTIITPQCRSCALIP